MQKTQDILRAIAHISLLYSEASLKQHVQRKLQLFLLRQERLLSDIFFMRSAPFLSFLSFLAVIFFAVCVLVSFNVFHILLPGFLFPPSMQDRRSEQSLYVFSKQKKKLEATKQALYQAKDWHSQVKLLAAAISTPPRTEALRSKASYSEDILRLPFIGFAIEYIWEHEGELIIHLNADIMKEELAMFLAKEKQSQKETYYLDIFFRALCASIFALKLHKPVQSIAFLLNGKKRNWPGMKFDLRKQYRR